MSSYHGGSNGSNQSSDSEEDSNSGSLPNGGGVTQHGLPPGGGSSSNSPPSTPGINAAVPSLPQQPPHSPIKEQTSPGANFSVNGSGFRAVAREFFPAETPEPNTSMLHSAAILFVSSLEYNKIYWKLSVTFETL